MNEEFTLDITPNFAAAWQRVERYWPERAIILRALKWVLSDRMEYAAVNRTEFHVNPTGLLGPDFEGSDDPVGRLAFLLVHEAGHIDHFNQFNFEELDPETSNKASDFVVNGDVFRVNALLKEQHGFDFFPSPGFVCFDEYLSSGRYSMIQVYRILIDDARLEVEYRLHLESRGRKENRSVEDGDDPRDPGPVKGAPHQDAIDLAKGNHGQAET